MTHDGTGSAGAALLALAERQPDRPAVTDQGQVYTYAQFAEDFRRILTRLTRLNVPKDALVAVEWDGLYRHWLLLLGFESLGIATASYVPAPEESGFAPILERAALTMGPTDPPSRAVKFLKTDRAWWRDLVAYPLSPLPDPVPSDRILRVISGSGTTGSPKLMGATAGQIAYRREAARRQLGFTSASRNLIGMSLVMQSDYRRAMVCLMAGGHVIFAPAPDVAEAIRRIGPSHATLMPRQVLDVSDGPPVPGLTLSLIGARATPELRARLARTLTDRLIESYGANETGSIATIGPDGLGEVLPGMEVSIVDTEDQPVPAGQIGRVRVRGPGVIDGYLNDAEATGDRFRDGWFLPGDLGMVTPEGYLRLEGRSDDILNILGHKILAPEFEARMRRHPAIADAGLCVTRLAGEDLLCAVICPTPGISWPEVEALIHAQFTPALPKVLCLPTQDLPRTRNGKLRRGVLLADVEKRLATPGDGNT